MDFGLELNQLADVIYFSYIIFITYITAGGCGSLTPPANGDVIVSGTDVGDTATYSCNGGYKLIGDSSRTCRPNGRWSGQEPTCQGN